MVEVLQTWQAWNEIHQPFELKWWTAALLRGHCSDPGWKAVWQPVVEFVQPSGAIIDIGCGPRPPFAPCTVIEPLADDYRKLVPAHWWRGVVVYAQPAETYLEGLRADTVICWNCIDHAIGWRDILDNMLRYGNENARFAIATDFHKPFVGHPGFGKLEFMEEIQKRFVIVNRREPLQRAMALLMKARNAG